ncbi:MAG: hypothetical protein P4L84_37750 [Isosphaeraceae bacterium]|nr:hypothetical protein [Isosphaeraceae bacterium]
MLDLELLRANRTVRLVFPFAVLLAFLWLSRNGARPISAPQRVSLDGLERATEHLPFLTLFGRQGRHYRFHAPDGRVFLVDHSEVQPVLEALPFTVQDGVGVFVKCKGGKLTVPDPRVMSEWVGRHGVEGPMPAEAIGAATGRNRILPVVRHVTESEPELLVLTSDGDWTGKDLARLNTVLNDWLATERPGAEDGKPLPVADRPRLWYDAANSARDLKTIVVRAQNFEDAWCEPLARRLGLEYPFLWQLDVGDKPGPVLRGTNDASHPSTTTEVVD